MQIDLNAIDREQFMVHDHIVNGEVLCLVQPQAISAKWNQSNKIFRSSVWNAQGELVSASWPKFVNLHENPEVFPVPTDLKKCKIFQKIDGSTLIVSKYKGQFIFRTRGTLDASTMEKNGYEVADLMVKHPEICRFSSQLETWSFSLLFEWVSPLNRIVLLYPEPKLFFLGIVNHNDYSLWNQAELDLIAKAWGVERPKMYSFDTIEDMVEIVKQWEGLEGVVIYSDNDQMMHKAKSDSYLVKHRLKSELSSFEKLIDFWITVGKPESFNQFQDEVEKLTDYETAQEHIGDISRIIDGYKEVKKIIDGMISFIKTAIAQLPDRKCQALKIIESYGSTGRSAMLFKLLDSKALDSGDYKKLLFQVLKK